MQDFLSGVLTGMSVGFFPDGDNWSAAVSGKQKRRLKRGSMRRESRQKAARHWAALFIHAIALRVLGYPI